MKGQAVIPPPVVFSESSSEIKDNVYLESKSEKYDVINRIVVAEQPGAVIEENIVP